MLLRPPSHSSAVLRRFEKERTDKQKKEGKKERKKEKARAQQQRTCNLHTARRVDKDIGRLEVTVQDAARVHVLERAQHLVQYVLHVGKA